MIMAEQGDTELRSRENPGASHFAIITPGDPVYAANEPAMMALLHGTQD